MTQLEPFQKILVRDNDDQKWHCGFFSHIIDGGTQFRYRATDGVWRQCIPYEGNEHLLGTTDSPTPPEPEFKFGDKVAISYNGKDWSKAVYIRKVDGDMPHEVLMQVPWHYGGQEYHVKFCRHEEW